MSFIPQAEQPELVSSSSSADKLLFVDTSCKEEEKEYTVTTMSKIFHVTDIDSTENSDIKDINEEDHDSEYQEWLKNMRDYSNTYGQVTIDN